MRHCNTMPVIQDFCYKFKIHHKRSPGYAELQAHLYTKSLAHVVNSLHTSVMFVKAKLIMAGWLNKKTQKN